MATSVIQTALAAALASMEATARPRQPPATDHVSAEQAQEIIRAAMMSYLDRPQPNALIIAAPPGVGKTYLAVELAERIAAAGQRVLFLGPRHDLYSELTSIARRPEWWQHWLPRQEGSETREETCRHAGAMERWLARGYDAMSFCAASRVCGYDYVARHCPYHAQQRQGSPIVYGQHAHLMGMPGIEAFDVIIGDENPMAAFLHQWMIPARHIAPAGMDLDDDLTILVQNLADLATRQVRADGADLLTLLGGAERVAEATEALANLPEGIKPLAPALRGPDAVDDTPYGHLPTLARLLNREARRVVEGLPALPRVAIGAERLHLLKRRRAHVETASRPLIWLDGTANERVYTALLSPRPVTVVAPTVATRGRIIQVHQRANGKGALFQEDQPTGHAEQLVRLIRTIAARYDRPALVSFDAVRALIPELPSLNFAAAGSNALQECDALIVAGAPLPSLVDIEKTARMLFYERDEPFNAEWTRRPDYEVIVNGKAQSHETGGYWADDDLSALVWQVRERGIIQAAHRARPIRREVDIYLLTNIDIDGYLEVNERLSMAEVVGAPSSIKDPTIWADMVNLAEVLDFERGYVSTVDLMSAFDISKPTAKNYINLLAKHFGWATDSAPITGSGRRGRPPHATGSRIDINPNK